MTGRYQKGFSLLEVLIAVLIFGIGLLGVAAVQVMSLQNAVNSDLRTHANLAANELGERVRTDLDNVNNYTSARTANCPTAGSLVEWCRGMQLALPDAEYRVVWSAANRTLDIELWWFERQMYTDATVGSDPDDAPTGEVVSHYAYQVRFR